MDVHLLQAGTLAAGYVHPAGRQVPPRMLHVSAPAAHLVHRTDIPTWLLCRHVSQILTNEIDADCVSVIQLTAADCMPIKQSVSQSVHQSIRHGSQRMRNDIGADAEAGHTPTRSLPTPNTPTMPPSSPPCLPAPLHTPYCT